MNINFKTATKDDCDLMFKWANDIETRKNAFNSNSITYFDHVNWYSKLNLDNVLIFSDESQIPIGVVRIDNKEDEWVITTMVDSNQRNKGYGYNILVLGTSELFRKNPTIHKIIAYIKEKNIPSIKVFEKAGFILENMQLIHGFSCLRMSIENNNN